jgi:hypothetical protein
LSICSAFTSWCNSFLSSPNDLEAMWLIVILFQSQRAVFRIAQSRIPSTSSCWRFWEWMWLFIISMICRSIWVTLRFLLIVMPTTIIHWLLLFGSQCVLVFVFAILDLHLMICWCSIELGGIVTEFWFSFLLNTLLMTSFETSVKTGIESGLFRTWLWSLRSHFLNSQCRVSQHSGSFHFPIWRSHPSENVGVIAIYDWNLFHFNRRIRGRESVAVTLIHVFTAEEGQTRKSPTLEISRPISTSQYPQNNFQSHFLNHFKPNYRTPHFQISDFSRSDGFQRFLCSMLSIRELGRLKVVSAGNGGVG